MQQSDFRQREGQPPDKRSKALECFKFSTEKKPKALQIIVHKRLCFGIISRSVPPVSVGPLALGPDFMGFLVVSASNL